MRILKMSLFYKRQKFIQYSRPISKSVVALFSFFLLASFIIGEPAGAKVLNSVKPATISSSANVTNQSQKDLAISAQLSRSRSLVDFKDGSRSDSTEFSVRSTYKTFSGKIFLTLGAAQDMNDSEAIENGLTDSVVGFSFKPMTWKTSSIESRLGFTMSAVIPTSNTSKRQTLLKSAISSTMNGGIKTEASSYGEFDISGTITAGRSFHDYEDDVNGSALSQYSSNQNLTLGYSISEFSLSFEFWNRSRWTYQNEVRQSFVMSQEMGYQINSSFAVAAGHTNEGSVLKANGQEYNIDLYNDDTSTIYGSLSFSY